MVVVGGGCRWWLQVVVVGGGCISFCVQILRDFEISNFFVSNLLTN